MFKQIIEEFALENGKIVLLAKPKDYLMKSPIPDILNPLFPC